MKKKHKSSQRTSRQRRQEKALKRKKAVEWRKKLEGSSRSIPSFANLNPGLSFEGRKPSPLKLSPDYGHFCYERFGSIPHYAFLMNPMIIVGDSEGTIDFKAGNHLGTILVSPEVARKAIEQLDEHPLEGLSLRIYPGFGDRYKTRLGEWVVPFKVVDEGEENANSRESRAN